MCGQGAFLAPGPETQAKARTQPPGTALALGRLGAADGLGDESRKPCGPVGASTPRQPAIDDRADPGDRQRGLGDGRGQHHPALVRGTHDGLLFGKGHGAVEVLDRNVGKMRPQQIAGGPDLAGPRKEGQHVAFRPVPDLHNAIDHGTGQCLAGRSFAGPGLVEPDRLDGMAPPGALDHIGIRHDPGKVPGVERCGHGHEPQFGAEGFLYLETEGEAEIGVNGALVHFVEQDRGDAWKFGIGAQHCCKNTFGDHLDPGFG